MGKTPLLERAETAIKFVNEAGGVFGVGLVEDLVAEIEKLQEEVKSTIPYLTDIIRHEELDLKISAYGAEITLNGIINRHKD